MSKRALIIEDDPDIAETVRYNLAAEGFATELALTGEEGLAQEVVRASSGAALLSPKTSIVDLLALIRGAMVMISGDTGPTHVAAALGTPIVGIYGPTRPSRNGPWAPGDITISRDAICQCHHLRRCTRERMCLLDVEAAEVLDAVERRLAAV